ncbi:hypothetical protein [Altererythrobacter ishigakiensis]|uniref:hypothetical protein n=1 Tax=Altererythrobacter ishigakiensis TaxID=476157 RepID=UPI00119CE003|nr:hypothetical protein [Altererythrobacter ishigakiensis]
MTFLSEGLGEEKASAVARDYELRGLSEWLGNPQTLIMLRDVIAEGGAPESTYELFESYIDLCLPDANERRRERDGELPLNVRKDVLGCAFAALILSGKSALARPGAEPSDEDLKLADLHTLLDENDWSSVSGNRLVRVFQADANRQTYAHRRIGEWLAARWLVENIANSNGRKRLLDALTVDGVVPASFRGLFGWLGYYPKYAEDIINSDPMGLIEYGDADCIPDELANVMLQALQRLATKDPYFADWRVYRAKCLVRGETLKDSLRIIFDPESNFTLRIFLARQLKNEKLPEDVCDRLKGLALEPQNAFSLREDAAAALVGNFSPDQMKDLIEKLRCQGSHDSTRLAAGLVLDVGLDAFDDQEVVQVIAANSGITISTVPEEPDDNMIGKNWQYRRDVPDERLGGFLDALAPYALELLPEYRGAGSGGLVDLGAVLIGRRLQLGLVEAERLLLWLRAFRGRTYDTGELEIIGQCLEDNAEVRQAMQQIWLARAEDEGHLRVAAHELREFHRKLGLQDGDVAAFLNAQPVEYPHWMAAAQLTPHSDDKGQLTRAAIARFVNTEADLALCLETLLNPPKPQWQIEDEAAQASVVAERENRWAQVRAELAERLDELSIGSPDAIVLPAQVYFGNFGDLAGFETAIDRITAVYGQNLVPSILGAFEAYLNRLPSSPKLSEIARLYSENRYLQARYCLLSGLSERLRQAGGLGQLTRDQLIAAQMHCAQMTFDGDEWRALESEIWSAICEDQAALEQYARMLLEPKLEASAWPIAGMYELLNFTGQENLAVVVNLAFEWLARFPCLDPNCEMQIVEFLMVNGGVGRLETLALERLATAGLELKSRRGWQVILLLSNFEAAAIPIEKNQPIDPGLFWALHGWLDFGSQSVRTPLVPSIKLAAWIVATFRVTFPHAARPGGTSHGDENPWDASAFMRRLIDLVGSANDEEAVRLLEELAEAEDDYREHILKVQFEQARNIAEHQKSALSVDDIQAILGAKPAQIIHLIHGIRTHADWVDTTERTLRQNPDLEVAVTKYGWFDLVSFLLPGRSRRWPIKKVSDDLLHSYSRAQREGKTLSVIAHSNGTYATVNALKENPNIELEYLLLCGAVIGSRHSLHEVKKANVRRDIINDYGTRDIYPAVAASVTWGYGNGGTYGIGTPAIDRRHPVGHSEFFQEQFVEDFWVPVFEDGTIARPNYNPHPTHPFYYPIFEVQWRWLILLLTIYGLGLVADAFVAML